VGEQVDSSVFRQVAVERPVGPNIFCSQIEKTRPAELVTLFSLAQYGTGTLQ
jgi:hypothetical protein